jgi:hypothetical protein
VLITDSDLGRGQEGDTEGAVDSDAATGADTESRQIIVADADSGVAISGSASVFVLAYIASDIDGGTGAEAWSTAAGKSDADAGTGADVHALLYAPADVDAATGAEEQWYAIGVFPFPPPWLFGPSGGLRVVWHYEMRRDMATLEFPSDSDAGGGAEGNGPTAVVTQLVAGVEVTCAKAREAALVLLVEEMA